MLSDSVTIALIGAMASVVPSTVAAILSFLTHQQQAVNTATLKETQADVKLIERSTNGMKDELIVATKIASHAEGVARGVADEKQAQAERTRNGES